MTSKLDTKQQELLRAMFANDQSLTNALSNDMGYQKTLEVVVVADEITNTENGNEMKYMLAIPAILEFL
jgi:hypothetical protein